MCCTEPIGTFLNNKHNEVISMSYLKFINLRLSKNIIRYKHSKQ